MDTFPYHAEAQLTDGSAVLINLEQQGWANKDLLAATTRWTLLPKGDQKTSKGTDFPIVVVNIPEGGKAVFKSRVFGSFHPATETDYRAFRCFAIGYKLGRKTYWTWVLPTGDIEVGDDPWLAELLLKQMKSNAS
jgi:hypothetical protein